MANDKDQNKIKNPELLNPNKDTQQERLDKGSKGNPSQSNWVDNTNMKRVDIKKPGIYDEAMKANDANQQKDVSKQIDKDQDHDKN